MNPLKFVLRVLCWHFPLFLGNTDSLSGSVQTENDSVVRRATVRLGYFSTTTDSNGNFVLDGVVPIRFSSKEPGKESLVFQGNVLKVNLISLRKLTSPFRFRGRTIRSLHPGVLQAGFHAISVHAQPGRICARS